MIGIEYYRRIRQLRMTDLAQRSGVTVETIRSYVRKGVPDGASVAMLVALADALDISIDALVADYDECRLTPRDRYSRSSCINSPNNVVSNYRIWHHLRYDELAALLNLKARESARTVCKRETAKEKYIRMLASYEGISLEAFTNRYATVDPPDLCA